jgi:hygromycin-B 7''-O-kinase
VDDIGLSPFLAAAGASDEGPFERMFSYANDVWVGQSVVLRVSRPDSWTSQRHEEQVLGWLPPTVPHAEVLRSGVHAGRQWLLMRRVPGQALGRLWPAMAPAGRRAIVHQLGAALRALHAVPIPRAWQRPDLAPDRLARLRTPREVASSNQPPLAHGLAIAAAARTVPNVDRGLVDAELDLLVSRLPLFADDRPVLVHADLHWENMLSDGTELTALLDFETARPAAADLDLDGLLRFSRWPHLVVAEEHEQSMRPEDFRDVPVWLAEAYPELLAAPNLRERLETYAVVYDLRLGIQYPPRPDAPPWHAWSRLRATVDGRGYLREWLP